jgi:hypothetical protein
VFGLSAKERAMPIKWKDYMNKGFVGENNGSPLYSRDCYEIARWIRDILMLRRRGSNSKPMGMEHLKTMWRVDRPEFGYSCGPELEKVLEDIFESTFISHLGFYVTDEKIELDGKRDIGVSLP